MIITITILLLFNIGIQINVIKRKGNIKVNKVKEKVIKLILKIYFLFLIAIVYFPITIVWMENKTYKMPKIYLFPIQAIIKMYNNKGLFAIIINIGGNLILLTPLAFFMCYYFKDIFCNIKNTTIATLFISLFIECSQVTLSIIIPMYSRVFDVNDLICNTIGGIIGYKLYKIYMDRIKKRIN